MAKEFRLATPEDAGRGIEGVEEVLPGSVGVRGGRS
jgi:hypothetical protein